MVADFTMAEPDDRRKRTMLFADGFRSSNASEWVEQFREFWEGRLDALAVYLESQETDHMGNLRHGAAVGHCMTRKLIPIVFVVVAAGLIWSVIAGLETAPTARDEATAVILRAPDGFDVDDLKETGIATAAAELAGRSGDRPGVEFTDGGDRIILLVDRKTDRMVELRASRNGTIVERIWPGSIDERLAWATANGRLDAPGLEPATGKNLYH